MLRWVLKQGVARRVRSVSERMRRIANNPFYTKQTLIRPPDLTKEIEFPIKMPMRIRSKWQKPKEELVQDTSKIHWARLSPNEILLGLQHAFYLHFREVVAGLEMLAGVEGQQKHDWNKHPWVRRAMDIIHKKSDHIRSTEIMTFYHLMKSLRYNNPQFWQGIYRRIEDNLYEFYPSSFEYIFITYYKDSDKYFRPEIKGNMLKLMEGRLREFKPASILQVFEIFFEEKRLDEYWLSNVFVSLFKSPLYSYTPQQLCKIFQFMMMVNHEHDDRLYANLYARILKYPLHSVKDIDALEDTLLQVQEIFISHRVQQYITHLQQTRKKTLISEKLITLPLHEIVRQDLIFFMNKRRLASTTESPRKTPPSSHKVVQSS